MSCNGCRVLRKGCSDICVLRPCLQWIEGAEAQGHATVFVAKFFGRAGLMGFIAAVPENQRPALFRSLLYEACGRTVNPVYGAVGLLWSGHWHICQAAVDTVLRGGSIKPTATSPSNLLPCYGPMPNLPRLHTKPTPSPSPPPPQADHQRDDVKRFKPLDPLQPHQFGPGAVRSNGEDVGHVAGGGRPASLDRPLLVAVKRERDEGAEPVARRPRVGRSGTCQLDAIAAVEGEAIDLDLTLSSHPPTPQLFVPPRRSSGGAAAATTNNRTMTNAMNNVAAAAVATATATVTTAAASPVSCSNSFSSEGSVTSLDTADFIASASNSNADPAGVPGMDLLQRMERRQQHHHHHHHHHHHNHSRQIQ